jgi:hypothetical protein
VVHLPQLPPGRFTLREGDAETHIEVREQEGTLLGYSLGGGGRQGLPVWLLGAGAAAAVVVLVLSRKRRGLLLAVPLVLLGTAGVWFVGTGAPASGWRDVPWEACDQLDEPEQTLDCKVQSLLGHIERQDYDRIADLLTTTRDPACHDVAHRASYHTWRQGGSVEQAKMLLIPGCDDGLIHGTVEAMATFSDDARFSELLVDFCSGADAPYKIQACLHGGGHATIWRTNGDLSAAWALCDTLPADLLYEYRVQEECKGSAVMEWSDRWETELRSGHQYLQPRIDEPMELCVTGPRAELFRLGCYLGTNHRTGDAGAAAEWCSARETYQTQCFQAVGENLPYFETPTTLTRLEPAMAIRHATHCTSATRQEAVDACVTAMVRVYALMTRSYDQAEALCGELPGAAIRACREGFDQAGFVAGSRRP